MSSRLTPTGARAQSRRAGLEILVKAADGPWMAVGSEVARGVFPEQESLSANEGGPDTCSFLLRRRSSLPWPDLAAFNQAQVWIDGAPVWGGRIWEAPFGFGGEDAIAVQGRGWQYHLDDDLVDMYWVHTDMTAWKDLRAHPDTDLNEVGTVGSVESGNGALTIGYHTDQWVQINLTGDRCGFYLDLGPNRKAKRIVFDYEADGDQGNLKTYVIASDTQPYDVTGATLITGLGGPASGVVGFTLATARRYVGVMAQNDSGAAQHTTSGCWFKAIGIKVFAATAYESGGASTLKADRVIDDVLASGAVPLLSDSTHLVAAGSFSIPDLAPAGYQTPRQLIAAANAYEGNLVGVNAEAELFSIERDVIASLEASPSGGFTFHDATENSAEELYNQVIVQGTAPDGTPVSELRTTANSLVTRQGFNRTATLNVSAPITPAAAEILGDVFLREYAQPKFKGTATFQGHGSVRLARGATIHPSQLMLFGGRMIRIPLVDPATGAWTRDCLIKDVRYDHPSETATVELDSERGNFATLLNRYGVTVSQALARSG